MVNVKTQVKDGRGGECEDAGRVAEWLERRGPCDHTGVLSTRASMWTLDTAT